MPIDVEAAVIANTRLSDEYNVVALDASAIARDALPGQFVMVKPAPGNDPLLRRPFSIFEILRDGGGRPTGVSILNKRVGVGSRLLFDAVPGSRVPCLGPLGRPFLATDHRGSRATDHRGSGATDHRESRATDHRGSHTTHSADVTDGEAWMVAGGVGLAPFATVAEALAARRVPATLFYGGRRSADLFYVEFFERLGVRVVLATEDGSRGERGRVTVPLERALAATPPDRAVTLYVCGPTPMMAAAASLARRHGRRAVASLEQVMGCGLGGCYSCVVQVRRNGSAHFVRSCIDGPVFDAEEIVWEELTGHQ